MRRSGGTQPLSHHTNPPAPLSPHQSPASVSAHQSPSFCLTTPIPQLLSHYTNTCQHVPPFYPFPPGQRPKPPPSTFSKTSAPSPIQCRYRAFCALSPRALEGRRQPIFQQGASWPLESLLKHYQCVVPTSFWGRTKAIFLFYSLDGEKQDPFMNSTFSPLA